MPNPSPLPDRSPVLDGDRLSHSWREYLQDQQSRTPQRWALVQLETQEASIASTTLLRGLDSGLYRLTYYARISRAASTNSSLTVTFGWTDDTVAQSYSGAAMTGNSTTTNQSGTIMVEVDALSSITYATTYASTGATSMQYKLDITVHRVFV